MLRPGFLAYFLETDNVNHTHSKINTKSIHELTDTNTYKNKQIILYQTDSDMVQEHKNDLL